MSKNAEIQQGSIIVVKGREAVVIKPYEHTFGDTLDTITASYIMSLNPLLLSMMGSIPHNGVDAVRGFLPFKNLADAFTRSYMRKVQLPSFPGKRRISVM